MTDLRKAAEMALTALETSCPNIWPSVKECLRQALAQPEQEPVAWVYNGILHEFDPSDFATSEVKPLYTAPPKREWVGLTDEERSALENKYKHIETGWRHDADLIAETEAKLKEKNT